MIDIVLVLIAIYALLFAVKVVAIIFTILIRIVRWSF